MKKEAGAFPGSIELCNMTNNKKDSILQSKERHIPIIATYYFFVSVLITSVAVIGSFTIESFFIPIFVIPLAIFILINFITGLAVIQRKMWGRTLAIILGAVNLINFPVGTFFGIYSLVILMDEEGKACFRKSGAS